MSENLRLPNGKPLATLRVVDLRKELRIRKLPTHGRKAELLKRLEEFIAATECETRCNLGNTQSEILVEANVELVISVSQTHFPTTSVLHENEQNREENHEKKESHDTTVKEEITDTEDATKQQ